MTAASTAQAFECRVCGLAQEGQTIAAREIMYGTAEPFPYVACAGCDCVQIVSIPDDLGRYYPSGYYSMNVRRDAAWRAFLKSRRAARARGRLSVIGAVMGRLAPTPPPPAWLPLVKIGYATSVLDVGCGNGQALLQLRDLGYSNLTGADPFIEHDLQHWGGVRIRKQQVAEIRGQYEVVMLHHSLEHMPDQLATMREVRRLIAPGGRALIRIPLLGFAWREYGVDWLGLDPPRHLYAHSVRSFTLLAERAGFTVASVTYDSSGMQFWAAEQFRRGITLWSPRSVASGSGQYVFSAAELADFERRAAELNSARDGDQGCFVLHTA